jgi:hypothetical protein
MKIIVVKDENWFKKAPFADVKMVGIKHLGIPAEKFAGKQPEPFKRAMVRQVFAQKDLEYGIEFEIMEANNPFGQPKRKRSNGGTLTGTYSWVKNGIRAPEGDVRHDMMRVIERNDSFEEAIKDWQNEGHAPGEKYKNTGQNMITFEWQIQWSLMRGWIIKTGEE